MSWVALIFTFFVDSRVQRIDFHMGRGKENGSEHTINGRRFPMEVQLVAFNTDLYPNFTSAAKSPHGIAILSVLVDVSLQVPIETLFQFSSVRTPTRNF